MNIDLADLSSNQVYHLMIQTLIPRPIAWILTGNEDGGLNLAPFSYFTCVSSKPALLMISVGRKPDGAQKDTWRNIEERSSFVVHIPRSDDVPAVAVSSGTYPANESEIDIAKVTVVPEPGWDLPRVVGPRVAYQCRRFAIHEICQPSRAMILGEIQQVYVEDDVVTEGDDGRWTVDPIGLDPLARLGGNGYCALGPLHDVPRPK